MPPQTGRLCARSRRQAGETERKSLPLVTNLFFWRTRQSRQQVRASCSRHCDSGQNMSPGQLTRGFPCYSRQDTSAGDTSSSFNCQTEKTSFYLELFRGSGLSDVKTSLGSNTWEDSLWSLPSRLGGARPFRQQLRALSDLLVTPRAARKPPNR